MNFFGSKDLVVSKESSSFDSREISYLESNFIQLEFDVTHMKNPLSLFTDLINNSLKKFMDMAEITTKVEEKVPSVTYLTNDPIYNHLPLIKKYFELLPEMP